MTEPFRSVYRQLSDDARNYADPDRALKLARDLRRRSIVALSAVLTIVVAVSTVLVTRLYLGGPSAGPGLAVGATGPVVVPVPVNAASLPAEGVGPATLAYAACRSGCRPHVLLADGTQYVVPAGPGSLAFAMSLSPDGRWLAYPVDNGYQVRDLTSSRVLSINPSGRGRILKAWAWSVDSALLLLAEHGEKLRYEYSVLNLHTGDHRKVPAPPVGTVVGLLPTGELLTMPSALGEGQWQRVPVLELTIGVGETARTLLIDASSWLNGNETLLASDVLHPAADGGFFVVVTALDNQPAGILRVSAGGLVLDRQDIPRENSTRWYVAGSDGSAVILGKETSSGQQATTVVTAQTDGQLREVARLPQEAVIVVRGDTMD